MTVRAIWLPAGSPFPAHADFDSEQAAEVFALGMLGVEVAIVRLGGTETALGATNGDAAVWLDICGAGSERETGKR